jgi:hypothetical protein
VSLPAPDSGTRSNRAPRRSGWAVLRYLLAGLLAIAVGGLTLATATSVAELAHRERTEAAELIRTGVATVSACSRQGPVSARGFGLWDTCQVAVTWSDGSVEVRETRHDFFRTSEVGQRIPVGEIRVMSPDRSYHPVLIREAWPNDGSYVIAGIALSVVAILLLLGGLGCLLAAIGVGWRRLRRQPTRAARRIRPIVEAPLDPIGPAQHNPLDSAQHDLVGPAHDEPISSAHDAPTEPAPADPAPTEPVSR